MENKQAQIAPLKPSTMFLDQSNRKAIAKRLGEVAILKGINLTEFQLVVWLKEIENDLNKQVITVDGVIKALNEFPREKTYGNLDYYNFYELAKAKSNLIEKDILRTKEYLGSKAKEEFTSMPKEIKDLISKL